MDENEFVTQRQSTLNQQLRPLKRLIEDKENMPNVQKVTVKDRLLSLLCERNNEEIQEVEVNCQQAKISNQPTSSASTLLETAKNRGASKEIVQKLNSELRLESSLLDLAGITGNSQERQQYQESYVVSRIDTAASNDVGNAYYAEGKYDQAIKCYKEVLE